MDSSNLIANIDNPINLFDTWYKEAVKSEIKDPNAMSLATSTNDGFPSVRMVLMKEYDERGFVFYTNKNSRKGREIELNKNVAVCFHWKSLSKQVRIEGVLNESDSSVADKYFLSRSRLSQISALASEQSAFLENRDILLNKIRKIEKKYEGKVIPRPDHWTGFCIVPKKMEFWLDQPYRAHDRLVFSKKNNYWVSNRLYP